MTGAAPQFQTIEVQQQGPLNITPMHRWLQQSEKEEPWVGIGQTRTVRIVVLPDFSVQGSSTAAATGVQMEV